MTKKQIMEFAAVERAYLDAVREGRSPSEQIQCMEVLFYWIEKQLTDEGRRTAVVKGAQFDMDQRIVLMLSYELRREFAYLQMDMVKAWIAADHTEMVEVEIKMRAWIDVQLGKAMSKGFKPKIRITPANGGNRKN